MDFPHTITILGGRWTRSASIGTGVIIVVGHDGDGPCELVLEKEEAPRLMLLVLEREGKVFVTTIREGQLEHFIRPFSGVFNDTRKMASHVLYEVVVGDSINLGGDLYGLPRLRFEV